MNQNREFTLMLNNFAANCPFSFSNLMMQSPLRYSMMERRFLYKLAEEIKRRYTQMGLSSRDNWKNFVFRMTNNDLACLGGKSNWKRTYKVIRQLGFWHITIGLMPLIGMPTPTTTRYECPPTSTIMSSISQGSSPFSICIQPYGWRRNTRRSSMSSAVSTVETTALLTQRIPLCSISIEWSRLT